MGFTIRTVELADKEEWKAMVADYDPDLKMGYEAAWNKIWVSDSDCNVVDNGVELMGFVNLVHHEFPLQAGIVCYLADLYIKPKYRRCGYARTILYHIIDVARSKGWERLYWVTELGNFARDLYDEVAHPDFIRYHIDL